jgi:hypothetical protein
MKQIISFLVLSLVLFSSCKEKKEDVLADIKEKRTKIDTKLNDYTPKRIDDLAFKGAGTITGYYNDDELKKIYAEHFGVTRRTFTEYYFDDGMVIFILKQDYVYNQPNSYTEEIARAKGDSVWYDDKKTKLEVSRFYFDDNKLIKWVNPDGTTMPVNTADFINKESELWGETIILVKQLKEQ